MMRVIARVWLALLVLLLASAAWAQAPRVALVVGNSGYQHVDRLGNPRADARLIAATLSRLGFRLMGGGAQLDLDRPAFIAAVRRFQASITPGAIAMFYYSGHGLQVDGTNFLVPIDAAPQSAADVPRQMIDAGSVLTAMARNDTALNVMVLDACRNNPFGDMVQAGTRGLRTPVPAATPAASGHPQGLAEMHAPPHTLISFATQPGSVAFDGVQGAPNSPYSAALARALKEPGLDVVGAFNRAGVSVEHATGGAQEPWLAISPLEQTVSLASPGAAIPSSAATPLPMAPHAPMRTPLPIQPATVGMPGSLPPSCPPAGTAVTYADGGVTRYLGAAPQQPEACFLNQGSGNQTRIDGIWPAAWPAAARAAALLRQVAAGPPGTEASFTDSADVESLNFVITSETWRFTVTNAGPTSVQVGGRDRPALHILWRERNLAHPYQGNADLLVDAATGVILVQSYHTEIGGSSTGSEFWSRYGGGLRAMPDVRATELRLSAP